MNGEPVQATSFESRSAFVIGSGTPSRIMRLFI